MSLKRLFLLLLIGFVAISALLGIGIILVGNFGEFEQRILGTSLTLTMMSLLGLACGASFDSANPRTVPNSGIVFSVVSAIVWVVLIWANEAAGEFAIKSAITTSIFAVALTYVSLLSLARLDLRFRWSRVAATVSVTLLVGVLLYTIWYDNNPNEDIIGRMVGSLSVLIGAFTVIIPVLHKLSGTPDESELLEKEIQSLKARIETLEKRKSKLNNND